MKKVLSFILAVMMLATMTMAVSAENPVRVSVENEMIALIPDPVIVNDRTLAPMEEMFTVLGISYALDEASNTIMTMKDGKAAVMQVDNTIFGLENEQATLDAAPQVVEGKIMIPVRAVAEAYGYNVDWVAEERLVVISGIPDLGSKDGLGGE